MCEKDLFTNQSTEEMYGAKYESSFSNSTTDTSVYLNSTNNTQHSLPYDWSYNFWPLIIVVMPIVTVGGNLLVIVSDLFLTCALSALFRLARHMATVMSDMTTNKNARIPAPMI